MPHVFCDMDGVLVDLIEGFKEHCGYCITDINHMEDEVVWKDALTIPKFWERLPKMDECDELVNHLAQYIPHGKLFVLSARQELFDTCLDEKTSWINTHAAIFKQENIKIVLRKEKQNFAVQDDGTPNILIDDYVKNIKEWENAGGIGIHHVTLESTIQKLSEHY